MVNQFQKGESLKLYRLKPDEPDLLEGKRIAIIGYGNQGRAQALNLRDGEKEVIIGLYPGSPSWKKAKQEGFRVLKDEEATEWADLISLLLPDERQPQAFQETIGPHLRKGQTILFAHGFSFNFGLISPPEGVDLIMVAPKGPGQLLREAFIEKAGLPCLVAIGRDYSGEAKPLALSYAQGIGGKEVVIVETTFEEETVTDLFGEQVVLCGGLVELARSAVDVLTEAGFSPENAYFECVYELGLIVDLLSRYGLSGMRERISNLAEYGAYLTGPRIIDQGVKNRMREVLSEIREGKFARMWIEENRRGRKEYLLMKEEEKKSLLNQIWRRLSPFIKRGGRRFRENSLHHKR